MLAASQAAMGMVVQEAHGLETGFRIGDKPFRIEVFADLSVATDWGMLALFSLGSLPYEEKSKKTAWIVARYEVFLPASNSGARLGFTKPRSTFRFCERKTSPAFHN
jgi:hypothetical protein